MTAHNSWRGMKGRCNNASHVGYKHYGGRGISYTPSWHDFDNFVADMGEPPTPEHEIDRIDNDGGYSAKNCRWATRKEQMNNTRHNHRLTVNGLTLTLSEWAKKLSVAVPTLHHRLQAGWSDKDAVLTPFTTRPEELTFTHQGETKTLSEWAKEVGLSRKRLAYRIKAGWPDNEIFSPVERFRHRIPKKRGNKNA